MQKLNNTGALGEKKGLTLKLNGFTEEQAKEIETCEYLQVKDTVFCRRDHALEIMRDEARKLGVTAYGGGFAIQRVRKRALLKKFRIIHYVGYFAIGYMITDIIVGMFF